MCGSLNYSWVLRAHSKFGVTKLCRIWRGGVCSSPALTQFNNPCSGLSPIHNFMLSASAVACVFQLARHRLWLEGMGGVPTLEFDRGDCTFCYQCASVCPQPIFKSEDAMPWQQVADIDQTCLSKLRVACRSCEDICDPEAIFFHCQIS